MKIGPTAGEPARCAGLRRALLHDWHDGFPLERTPFNAMARQLGGSLREVLGHCHTLSDEGALDAIRVRWSDSLQRVRWRCGLSLSAPPSAALQSALIALPGVTAWEWLEAPAVSPRGTPAARAASPAWPRLWVHLAALDGHTARAQLARLEAEAGPAAVVVLHDDAPPLPCTCARDGGPCTDVDLARHAEAGLPMTPHPYRVLSQSLQRTEREVLESLRRWERGGRLRSVGFDLAPASRDQHGVAVAVQGPVIDGAQRVQLLQQTGIVEVQRLRPTEAWPFSLWVLATGAPAQAETLLRRALKAGGLDGRAHTLFGVRRTQLRSAPLLFADVRQGATQEPTQEPTQDPTHGPQQDRGVVAGGTTAS